MEIEYNTSNSKMKIPSLATLVTAATILSGCVKTKPILGEQVKQTGDMIHSILAKHPSGTKEEVEIGNSSWTIDVNSENGVYTGAKVTKSYDLPSDYNDKTITCYVEVSDENGDGITDTRRFHTLGTDDSEEIDITKQADQEDQSMFMDGLRQLKNTETK